MSHSISPPLSLPELSEPTGFIQTTKLGEHDGRQYQHIHFSTHEGQDKALNSTKRFVLVLAGWRSGKSEIGPPWMFKQMRERGPGDYLIAAPTFPLLDKAAAKKIEHLFTRVMGLGRLSYSPMQYNISKAGEQFLWPGREVDKPTRIVFGHADEPDSLAAMDAKAAWLDEPGQKKFKLGSWDEIRARLSVGLGPCLLTTRPYALTWIKTLLLDKWEAAKRNHPQIDVINFDSLMNPVFPREEYEEAQQTWPKWKFNMYYRGLFERPAGMIYDKFDRTKHVWPRFQIPEHWPRFVGLDFGGVNTAATFWAEERTPDGKPLTQERWYTAKPGPDKATGRYFVYREYWPRESRSAAEHKAALLEGEPRLPTCAGGAKSEGQWRLEFSRVGLPMQHPVTTDVEVGINRLYGMIARDQLIVFEDCVNFLDELNTYSRVLDETGEPTDDIDEKETYHLNDSARYLACYLDKAMAGGWKMEWI